MTWHKTGTGVSVKTPHVSVPKPTIPKAPKPAVQKPPAAAHHATKATHQKTATFTAKHVPKPAHHSHKKI